nr:SPOR domain-containing protein [uncultured Noviherbaspirillum sp.]
MLKFVLGALLLANLALFAAQRGQPSGHEPARMNNQLYPERIRLLPASAASVAPPVPEPAPAVPATEPAPAAAAAPPVQLACIELLSFTQGEAARFENRIDALGLVSQLSRRELPTPSSYMVMLPPQGSRDAADQKTVELRGMGITDSFIIQDNSARRYGIALGTFRSQDAAQAHLETMIRRGARTARIAEVGSGPARLAIQMRALDPAAEAQVTRATAEFPRLEARPCS